MKLNYFIAGVGILLGAFFLQSCLDDKYENFDFPNALVTVKQNDEKVTYLQLDDKTTLFPVNLTSTPFGGKEVRALVNYKDSEASSEGFSKAVHVHWMDSIRTKMMVPDLKEENDEEYGNDPIDIINDWVTIAEDGYLTLRFRTLWGSQNKVHNVNLVAGVNPDDPYEVEFRHNAFGDLNGVAKDGLVAFKLNELPDTNGETVKLKLKWKSFDGDKTVEFDYATQKATPAKAKLNYTRNTVNVQ